MRKTKSIDELYEEVKHHDLVLTADVAMADALNRRLDRPHAGHFAVTPQNLAYNGENGFEKDIFLKLVNDLDLTWKQASFILGKTLDCWKESGDIKQILEFDEYSTEKTREVVEKLEEYDTPFKAMENFSLSGDVAVVNFYQFTELDKKVLPKEYEKYSIFKDQKTDLREFNSYSSGLELVKSLIENVEHVGPENAGIVVHPGSKYQSLLESHFAAEEIPFITQDEIDSTEKFRILISVIRTGLSDKTVRLKDVKPLTDSLGLETPNTSLNARLDSIEALEEFKEFLNVVEFLDLNEVVKKLEEISGRNFNHVKSLLEDTDLLNEAVTQETAEKILNFVNNFDVISDRENTGVLLADPRKTSVVDRPVVFLVGLGSEWSEKPDMEPWRDRERFESVNAKNFELLIQSGDKAVFMIEESFLEGDERPCHYFEEIFPEFELADQKITERTCETSNLETGFEKIDLDVETKNFVLSQSSLNNLVISPRVFYMSKLVSDVEEESMLKGTLFHDFAELYFNRPEETRERLDEVTEFFTEQMRPITDDISLKKLETELRIGLKRIMNFLDDKQPLQENGYEKKEKYPNEFEEELDIEIDTESTEVTFNDDDLNVTGKIDLVTQDNHLIDYKSGRKYSPQQIVKKSRIETAGDQRYPDLQALMYIAQHAEEHEGLVKFSFVYFLEGLGDEVAGRETDGIASTVTYYPKKFGEKASEIEIFESLFRDVKKSNKRRKTLEKLGYPLYSDFFSEKEFPEVYSKDELSETEFTEEFVSLCVKNVGDYKYVRKGARSALNKLIEFRNENFFSEDVEKFREFIEKKHEELEEYERNSYPVGGRETSQLPENDLVIE